MHCDMLKIQDGVAIVEKLNSVSFLYLAFLKLFLVSVSFLAFKNSCMAISHGHALLSYTDGY